LKSGQSFIGGHDKKKLWSKLKFSYEHSYKQHQNMLLDIACFFSGLKISTICQVWSEDYLNPKFELQKLQHISLI
jgi:hypothetical protein